MQSNDRTQAFRAPHGRRVSVAAPTSQQGFSLIEVLVAVLIFGVAVLGIALMQLKGAQFTKQAGARTVAVMQARSLADAMRANPVGVYGGTANMSTGNLAQSYYLMSGSTAPSSACADTACQQAHTDLTLWLQQLKSGTPKPANTSASPVWASVKTAPNGTGQLLITVTWSGNHADASGTDINESYSFAYQPPIQ